MALEDLLDILVCPACRGDLEYEPDVRFTCKACHRAYPIRNGIPIMLIDEAEEPPPTGRDAGATTSSGGEDDG
jgi:uncharacterized protein YbaR (Trm112 family)